VGGHFLLLVERKGVAKIEETGVGGYRKSLQPNDRSTFLGKEKKKKAVSGGTIKNQKEKNRGISEHRGKGISLRRIRQGAISKKERIEGTLHGTSGAVTSTRKRKWGRTFKENIWERKKKNLRGQREGEAVFSNYEQGKIAHKKKRDPRASLIENCLAQERHTVVKILPGTLKEKSTENWVGRGRKGCELFAG